MNQIRQVKYLNPLGPSRNFNVPSSDIFAFGPNNTMFFIDYTTEAQIFISADSLSQTRVLSRIKGNDTEYYLEVTWKSGVSSEVSEFTLTTDPLLASSGAISNIPSRCCPSSGGSPDYMAVFIEKREADHSPFLPTFNTGITGGVGPYTYQWSLVGSSNKSTQLASIGLPQDGSVQLATPLASSTTYNTPGAQGVPGFRGLISCLVTDANGNMSVGYYFDFEDILEGASMRQNLTVSISAPAGFRTPNPPGGPVVLQADLQNNSGVISDGTYNPVATSYFAPVWSVASTDLTGAAGFLTFTPDLTGPSPQVTVAGPAGQTYLIRCDAVDNAGNCASAMFLLQL
jgi:hypothetical protein